MSLNQRPTQTPSFWQTEFKVTPEAIEGLYNSFLEAGEPRFIDAIGLFFVKEALEQEEQAIRTELRQGAVYRPDQSYKLKDRLVFPGLDFALGTVVSVRAGYNPADGDFSILDVQFDGPTQMVIPFAADLKTHHRLSVVDGADNASKEGLSVADKIYSQYQHLIRPKIEQALRNNAEFVEFQNLWFLAGLLVQVQEGLLNIVDAAIDINGAPLNVDDLIEQIELQKQGDPIGDALRFSVNYQLERDPRFINVGTETTVLWYLNRLKPPQVEQIPHNLRLNRSQPYDVSVLPGEFRALLVEIDDEITAPEYSRPADPDGSEIIFVLTYPHRRSGTLPVLHCMRHLLPATNGRLIALQFVDAQSGDPILAWLVGDNNYIYGLEEWFQKYKLPVGAFIALKKTEHPLKFILDFVPQHIQREWIRVATTKNNQLAFQMKKRALSCRYDELMVIGEEGSEEIDVLWAKVEQNKTTLHHLLSQIFLELMKLTAQSAVHIKTLYSAVNVVRRCPPELLLQELATHNAFVWMGHGYWTYKPSN